MQYHQKKIDFLNLLLWLGFMWGMCFPVMLPASVDHHLPPEWVIDEQQRLHPAAYHRIAHVLQEAAKKRHVEVRVFIFDQKAEKSLQALADKKVGLWEKKHHTDLVHKQKAYLIINVATRESMILLGHQVIKDNVLMEGLNNIHHKILIPTLIQGDLDKAVWESAFALTMVLDHWPSKGKFGVWTKIKSHFSLHPLLGWLLLFAALWYGVKWYYRPQDEDVDNAESLTPEEILFKHQLAALELRSNCARPLESIEA
ncbi:MAG: hypothetical protein ACHQJ6_07700 [Candidatus Berkiellales bacterium]